jgi:hypothetical protein
MVVQREHRQVYNIPAVDLYSAKASRLRAKVYQARTAMLKADHEFRHATGIAQDVRNSDGIHGQRVAAARYSVAAGAYRRALKAWVRYVMDS